MMLEKRDIMKKRYIVVLLFSFIIMAFVNMRVIDNTFSIAYNDNSKIIIKDENEKIDISKIQEHYSNKDIIAYIEIPDVLSAPVAQTSNNDYYLNHDLYKRDDIKGSVFLDFRNKLSDRKILLYGHSGKEKDLPFLPLNNYSEESFYKEHPYIYLYTTEGKKKYLIFSAYIEDSDYDYVNLNSFSGLSYKEHLIKLKNKSNYNVDVNIDDNSKVIILQTCSMTNEGLGRYQIIVGIEKE
ncbi:MAG: class B sortase [Bacilli bacterium]|nr:class B sortase [Bacilli bacterium]